MEQFDSMLSPIIDQTLGQRCRSIIGYQYSEIIRSLMSVYFCGGSCVEDVTLSFLVFKLNDIAASDSTMFAIYHPILDRCSRGDVDNLLITSEICILVHFADSVGSQCFLRETTNTKYIGGRPFALCLTNDMVVAFS